VSALFDEPIKARTVSNDQPVLWVGVTERPKEIGNGIRLILADATGGLSLGDIGDIVIDWRYNFDPSKGAYGWMDKVHELEERTTPEPPGVDLEGLDDDE
jgi:hypothetical protein